MSQFGHSAYGTPVQQGYGGRWNNSGTYGAQYSDVDQPGPAGSSLFDPRLGKPPVGRLVDKYPDDDVYRFFTHPDAYAGEAQEVANRVWIAFFDKPQALIQLLLPAMAYDGETITWRDFFADVRPMPEISFEAPHETFWMRSKKQTFNLRWFGIMFAVDDSILGTPIDSFIHEVHARIMQGCLNLTVYINIMSAVLALPSMFERYNDLMMAERVKSGLSPSMAVEEVVKYTSRYIGIYDKGSELQEGGVTEMHIAAVELMRHTGATPQMKPDILMVPSILAEQMVLRVDNVNSQMNEPSIQRMFAKITGRADEDVLWSLNPSTISALISTNTRIIRGEAYRDNSGTVDLFLSQYRTGFVNFVDTDTTWSAEIVDIPRRRFTRIYQRGNDRAKKLVDAVGGIARFMEIWRAEQEGATMKERRVGEKIEGHPFEEKYAVDYEDYHAALAALEATTATVYNTAGCYYMQYDHNDFAAMVPSEHARWLAFYRTRAAFEFYGISEAHGGWDTGCTIFGRENKYDYHLGQQGRTEYHNTFRMGSCIAHGGHFVNNPYAKCNRYLCGGNALLHKPTGLGKSNRGHDFDRDAASTLPPGLFYYHPTSAKDDVGVADADAIKCNGDYFVGDYQPFKAQSQLDQPDVYPYFLPATAETSTADAQSTYKDKLESASIVCAGGRFDDEGDVFRGDGSRYDVIPEDAERVFAEYVKVQCMGGAGEFPSPRHGQRPYGTLSTGLQTPEIIPRWLEHGMGRDKASSLCWRAETICRDTQDKVVSDVPGASPFCCFGARMLDHMDSKMRPKQADFTVRMDQRGGPMVMSTA